MKNSVGFFFNCLVSLCPDENAEHPASAETPPPHTTANPEPVVESKQEVDSQIASPTELAAQPVAPVATTEVPCTLMKDQQSPPSLTPGAPLTTTPTEAVKVSTDVGDTVDAPVTTSQSLAAPEAPVKMEEPLAAPAEAEKAPEKEETKTEEVKKLEKEEQVPSAKSEPAVEVAAIVSSTVAKEEIVPKTATEVSQTPPPVLEPAAPQTQNADLCATPEPETAEVETAEPILPNGLPQETEELPKDNAFSDTTPHKKPEASQSQEPTPMAKTATVAQEVKEETEEKEEEWKKKSEDAPPASVSCPEESTMQRTVDFCLLLRLS